MSKLRGNTIGERLHDALRRNNMNKTDLSKAVGISWQALHAITDKGAVPKLRTAQKLASVLGVTVEELLGIAAGQEPSTASWGEFKRTSEYKTSTSEERRAVAAIMWPSGKEPTLSSYLLALQAVRSTRQKDGSDENGTDGGGDRRDDNGGGMR